MHGAFCLEGKVSSQSNPGPQHCSSATEAVMLVNSYSDERKVEMRKQVVQRVVARRVVRNQLCIIRDGIFICAMWKVMLTCKEGWEMLLKKLCLHLKQRCTFKSTKEHSLRCSLVRG